MSRHRKTIVYGVLSLLIMCSDVYAQRIVNHDYPRIFTLNWGGAGPIDWLKRFDLILGIDADSATYREAKQANPNMYVLTTTDWNAGGPFRIWGNREAIPAAWRLRHSNGSYITIYGTDYFVDPTDYCGLYNGERYNQALPRRLVERTSWTTFDGVSSDGTWSFPYNTGNDIDLDRNGVNDYTEHGQNWIEARWSAGQNAMRAKLRSLFQAKWGNPNEKMIFYWTINDTMCIKVANGVGWENMYINSPKRFTDWFPLISQWDALGPLPRINVVSADIVYDALNAPVRQKDYFRFVRWALGTTLLNNSYFMSGDLRDHHWTNYYDEFDVKLGYPKGQAQRLSNGCYVRFFDNGAVIVNPTNVTQTITRGNIEGLYGYEGPYYHFQGNQDPTWNDGSLFSSITLISTRASYSSTQYVGDGIILLKSPTKVISKIIVDNTYSGTSPGSAPASMTGFTWDQSAEANSDNPYWYTVTQISDRSSNYYDTYYASPGDGSAKAVFKPAINVSGRYRVYEWHGWRGRYTSSYHEGSNVPCTIVHRDGNTTITIDQNVNYGKWNLLGTFNFNAGGNYSATLTNNANGYVIADAFMFEYFDEGQQPPSIPQQISPSNGAVNQQIPVDMRWQSVTGAQSYSLQIATDVNFQNLIVNVTSITDTIRQISSLSNSTTYYWRVSASNAYGTSGWSQTWNFRTLGNLAIVGRVYYDVNNSRSLDSGDKGMAAWKVFLQGARNDTILLDSTGFFRFNGLPVGDYNVRQILLPGWTQNYPPPGAFYSVRLDTSRTVATCNFLNYASNVAKCEVSRYWNMVSLPVNVVSTVTTDVFPSANSRAFTYQGSYVFADNLEFGNGYWISFPYKHSIWIVGSPVNADTISINHGWNIIGSLSHPISVQSLQTIPSGLITSYVFAYDGSHYATDSIFPGGGYWLQSAQPGKLVMSSSGQSFYKLNDDLALFQRMNALTFSIPGGRFQQLYFTEDKNLQVCVSRSQLPPPLPDNFDARFRTKEYDGTLISFLSGKQSSTATVPIVLRSLTYPLTITWNLRDDKARYRLITDNGETLALNVNGEVILNKPQDDKLKNTRVFLLEAFGESDGQLPKVFEVTQNFPNPFNNETSVSFSLPATGHVKLDVYNLIGEHVISWLDNDMAAGTHHLHFDASNLSSGIYFYRVAFQVSNGKAESVVKRMVLLK